MSLHHIRDEAHLREMVIRHRERAFEDAKKQFVKECPHAVTNLLRAALELIDVYQKDRSER